MTTNPVTILSNAIARLADATTPVGRIVALVALVVTLALVVPLFPVLGIVSALRDGR